MRVAAVHSYSIAGAFAPNLVEVEAMLFALHKEGVQFALFPELNVSGYVTIGEEVEKLLKEWDKIEYALLQLSLTYDILFTAGYPERDGDKIYITNYLISKGKIIGKHRKTHLGPGESTVYTPSKSLEAAQSQVGTIGMQLCFEGHFPELSAAYAMQQTDILTFGFASPRETSIAKLERFKRFLPARAYDNGCFVMACNQSGISQTRNSFAGLSLIIDPKGKIIAENTGDISGFCVADIDLNEVKKIKDSSMGNFTSFRNNELIKSIYDR